MNKTMKDIIIISIILISTIIIALFTKQKFKKQEILLKENEIKINNEVFQVTPNKSDYVKFNNIEDLDIYENKSNFEIRIENPDIITYKNIKVGDSVSKLDFCYEPVPDLFYYQTNLSHKGYHLEIIYGINPFDNTIHSISYNFYNKK